MNSLLSLLFLFHFSKQAYYLLAAIVYSLVYPLQDFNITVDFNIDLILRNVCKHDGIPYCTHMKGILYKMGLMMVAKGDRNMLPEKL
jgi:hypothetical protein